MIGTNTKYIIFLRITIGFLILSLALSLVISFLYYNFLMLVQFIALSSFIPVFFVLDYSLRKLEAFPDYFNENGVYRINSVLNVIVASSSILMASLFILSIIYKLPQNQKTDLLPVVLSVFTLSFIALFAKTFIFNHSDKISNQALQRLVLEWYGKLFNFSFALVLLHAAITILNYYGFKNYSFILNIIASVSAFVIINFDSLNSIKKSIKNLLNDDVNEDHRFQALSFLAENIEYFCEFKKFNIRKVQDYLLVEFHVVLPQEYSLRQIDELEKELNYKAQKINNAFRIKLRTSPCNNECEQNGIRNCPVKHSGLNKNA